MDSEMEEEFISIVTNITFLASSTDCDSEFLSLCIQLFSAEDFQDYRRLRDEIKFSKAKVEFALLAYQINNLENFLLQGKLLSPISQVISMVSSMDLDSQPKPESELISLIKQIISLFNSKPDSDLELVSLITQTMHLGISVDSDSEPTEESELLSLINQLVSIKQKPELTSLTKRIISRFRSLNWEPVQLISLYPQANVKVEQGRFCVTTEVVLPKKEECHVHHLGFTDFKRKTFFHCSNCNGENHEGYEKAPVQAKHPLHQQHTLQLVFNYEYEGFRECYCCDKELRYIFYHCQACDYAMKFFCAEKPPVLSIDHPKWHQHHHPLTLFPSHDSLTCHLCAIKDSSCPFYICSPCGFVVHQKCLTLPRVIRISRHPHRISFAPSFGKEDWFCSVCRRKINNDYGGYLCIKEGCLYAAHSKCATQSNVWDGIELEGVPEETEEVLESFVKISDGIIQHFSHQDHHLRLVENTGREYNGDKLCQICVMPIYFGNFYSCVTCGFILHEDCANLSRKIHHAIHPHRLTLVGGYDVVWNYKDSCSACGLVCTSGFFYECRKEEDMPFKLHVQCATISEPLIHGSHVHPLFLTSKPHEESTCSVCNGGIGETFNCIEECDFSLCFKCGTIPQKVRYKHDKHILSLCYGEETESLKHWCEACEKKINPKKWFYKCDEYCCVTLHIECLIGKHLYMKPGSLCVYLTKEVFVMPNNQHMSRPICSTCELRCPFAIVFKLFGLVFCSRNCIRF